jgi:cell division septation protein DedD
VFDEPDAPDLSRNWIEDLMKSANSTGGIQLVPELLDTDPIPTEADQPVHVGADVQQVDVAGEARTGQSKPAASKPAQSKPAASKPAESKPATSKTAKSKKTPKPSAS